MVKLDLFVDAPPASSPAPPASSPAAAARLLLRTHSFFSELPAKMRPPPVLQGRLAHPLDRRLDVDVFFGADGDGTTTCGFARRRSCRRCRRRTPRPCGVVAARLLPVRIHAVAARVERADSDGAFAVKTIAEHIAISQIQPTSKQTPTRAKKNQAGAINLQVNIRRRSTAPLKMQKQAIQATFRDNGEKSRRKKDAIGTLAMNTQNKIIAPESLLQGRGGRHRRRVMAATTAGGWCAATTATRNTATTNASPGNHEQQKR